MSKIPFKIRDPKGDDLALILNSWLRSDRDNGRNRFMSQETYFDGFRGECVSKLESGFVTVACNPADEDQIYGWAAATEGGTVHYVYVKQAFRGYGVGKALLAECAPEFGKSPTTVTTAGKFHREWAAKYALKYDPYSWQKTPP